jgi:hypothetical protein
MRWIVLGIYLLIGLLIDLTGLIGYRSFNIFWWDFWVIVLFWPLVLLFARFWWIIIFGVVIAVCVACLAVAFPSFGWALRYWRAKCLKIMGMGL